jgi:hypothetical protein
MDLRGSKTALDEAVAAYRDRELAELPAQLSLFDASASAGGEASAEASAPGGAVVPRGPGRPPGARNRRTDEAARIYMSEFGDPLRRGVQLAALPLLAPGVVEGLSQRLNCSRLEAARWWASIYSATLPFLHQRLATLEVKPAGSPDGNDPVSWAFSDGELIDASADPQNGPDNG